MTSPKKENYNLTRTARMALFGTAVAGPILTGWYRTLALMDKAMKVRYAPVVGGWLRRSIKHNLGRDLPFMALHTAKSSDLSASQVLMAKVVADNLLFQAPFLNLYFLTMGALEGLRPDLILQKTKDSFHQAWALSILVWTPVQFINLGFVPIAYQALVVSAVNVGWKTPLSLLNHYHLYHTPPAHLERRDSELRRSNAALRERVADLWAENEELRARLDEVARREGASRRAGAS